MARMLEVHNVQTAMGNYLGIPLIISAHVLPVDLLLNELCYAQPSTHVHVCLAYLFHSLVSRLTLYAYNTIHHLQFQPAG